MYCFSKFCNLCLTKNNTLVNIKLCGSDGISFLNKLGQLAPSLIRNPRNYMLWICEQCRKRLKKAYRFIQHCVKSDAILEQYCIQLTRDVTSQTKCNDSEGSEIQLSENMINESIPMSFKEECYKDFPTFDDNQYYLESTITIDEHELTPVDFDIKLELKEEACFNVGNASTSNDEIIVSECDRDHAENLQIDLIVGTSGENNILSCSDDVPNDAKNHANSNMNSLDSLTKHQRIKSGKRSKERSFICCICDKTFTRSDSLQLHERIHSGERPYKCQICNKQFVRLQNLRQHERIHNGERSYKCKICNIKFARSGILKQHEKVHTGERPYKCEICNKKFAHSSSLKQHERIHNDERPYKCQICNKQFGRTLELKQHERIHTGERPYKCKICNLKFVRPQNLKQHEEIHTGERPYKCKICCKKFTRPGSLTIHKRVHTGEQPYKCEVCNKKFAYAADLKRHERIHSGERPYICKICNEQFIDSKQLKRHNAVHSGDRS